MRKIGLFELNDSKNNTKVALNIAAELARNDRKVLLIDFRMNNDDSILDLVKSHSLNPKKNAYNCLNENLNLKNHIQHLEEGLDIILGSFSIEKIDFNLYYELFKMNFVDRKLSGKLEDYDYVLFLCSPVLNQLTMNVLFFIDELVSTPKCSPEGYDFQQKVNRFLYHFRKYYSKELFFSKIVPFYNQKVDKEAFELFVSEFTNLLVSDPIPLDSQDENFAGLLKDAVTLIIEDEQRFDSRFAKIQRQKRLYDYYNKQDEKKEVPLSEYAEEEKTLEVENK